MKVLKSFQPEWHILYGFLLMGAIVWWYEQRQISTQWIKYITPVHHATTSFYRNENNNFLQNLEYFNSNAYGADLDSLFSRCYAHFHRQNDFQISYKILFSALRNDGRDSFTNAEYERLKSGWEVFRSALSKEMMVDTTHKSLFTKILSERYFQEWQKFYLKGNIEEKKFLLQSLLRTSVLALYIKMNDSRHLYDYNSEYFNAVTLVKKTDKIPVAGERFEIEILPVWYFKTIYGNTSIYANNMKLKSKGDGIYYGMLPFNSPGNKIVAGIMETKNPATGQVDVKKQTFQIEVTK